LIAAESTYKKGQKYKKNEKHKRSMEETTKMSKVSPERLPSSSIEKALKNINSNNFWLGCLGWSGIACFCAGMICLVMRHEMSEMVVKYKRLLDFYGGIMLARQMASRVRKESEKFKSAVIKVNNTTKGVIDGNLTLLELVKKNNSKFNNILTGKEGIDWNIIYNNSEQYNDYYKNVWEAYMENGGDSKVVINGYIELLLQNGLEPTSMAAIEQVNKILGNISLQNEMNQ
jgi:hypothetical protein